MASDQTASPGLARLRPDPIPAIHPLPEYLAEGERKQRYEEMKKVFQVPWMGVVTMAYAHYPTFYGVLWEGTKDLCASQPFVEAFQANRTFIEEEIQGLNPAPLSGLLQEMGYAPRELDSIRQIIEVFSHGNQPYLVLATLTRYLLESGALGGSENPAEAPAFEGDHAPDFSVPFVLMEAHHADMPTQAIYEDIKAMLGLPFVNTDYRAFARWPSYWEQAWADLRGVVRKEPHEALCQALHDRCLALAQGGLPNPGKLTPEALRAAAEEDASLEEVRAVCRLFQWLLPGLVTNVAFLRAQLLD